MRKLFLFISLFTFSYFSVSAQLAKDPKATVVLDKVSEKFSKYESINATFTYTLENKQENINDTYEGEITLKGNKYKLMLMDMETYFDGKTLASYNAEMGEVTLSTPSEDDVNPADMFTLYKEGFKYKYQGELKDDSNTAVIDLFPEDIKGKNYSRVRLEIDKAKSEIKSLKYFGKDGNSYTITLEEIKPNVETTDKTFTYPKSDDVDIIDMR